ncbi:uncharacterized protein [Euwallacea similis]|uniref:uncharacterized protein n=1 Tax=Euwallacea similis TaxID=1736056 RepID=UPI00344C8B6C
MPRRYLQVTQHHQNDTNHCKHNRRGYYASDEKFFWVLISLFLVVPIIILLLKIRRKLSGRCKSHQERRCRRDIMGTPLELRLSDSASVYTITKQDYVNLAPPRYSVISQNPVPTTYEIPPPYSPVPG